MIPQLVNVRSQPIADIRVLRQSALGEQTPMANPWARGRATLFYLGFGLVSLAVVALGFGVTYVLPMARRTFSAPWFVHFHGATALGWILLLIGQTVLVRERRTPLHRRVGQLALPLALLVWASGIATAVWAFGWSGTNYPLALLPFYALRRSK